MFRKLVIAASAAALSFGVVATTSVPAEAAAKKYSNCKKLNKVYKHGVGKKGARDHTSGTHVTNFTRNNKVYKANKARDRDKDGIACEKR